MLMLAGEMLAGVRPEVYAIACTSAVGYLWRMHLADHKATKAKLEDCEEDRERLWCAIAESKGISGPELRRTYAEKESHEGA